MSNSAETPSSSDSSSPPTPSNGSPPSGGDQNSSAPSSQSPPPPSSSPPPSSQSPPPSSLSPPPPTSMPPPSNSSPPHSPSPPPSSPPPPKDSSPPPSSPPPPSESKSPTPSPPKSPPPKSGSESPSPSKHSPPPSETPPSSGNSSPPPSPPDSSNTPAPANNAPNVPGSENSQQSPPPPSTVSPPGAISTPNTPGSPPAKSNPSPPTGFTPPTDSLSNQSPPSPSRSASLPPPSNGQATNTSTQKSGSPNGEGGSSGTLVGVTVAGVFILALVAVLFVFVRRRKRSNIYAAPYVPPNNFSGKSDGYYYGQPHGMGNSGPQPSHSPLGNTYGNESQAGNMYYGAGQDTGGGIGGSKSVFSYEELMEITGGFSHQNVIGEGGFGCVFKGWMPDGKQVAVKQLKAGSGQGEREFRAEVEIISRVHHRYLVSLVGYCISENQRLLIYEFVPNKTLEHHLHGSGVPVLEWTKRLKIALGAAKGLAYLHEDCHPKIIHRDIKSANILLDDAFEAQVADFGLAKLTNDTHTHVSTRVMGTFGYMAPEYASSGKLTDKSDVFSFGVVLLELITGRKPVDPTQPLGDESLVEWARPILIHALETGEFGDLVDPRLEKHYVEIEMFRMIEAAAACVRHSAPKRPRMVQVVRALDCEGEMSDLSNGVKYGQSTVYDSGQYNQDINKFRRMALGGGGSSEFDMYSGEYNSREMSGPPHSWVNISSGEDTRAFNNQTGGQRFSGAQGGISNSWF